MSVQGSDAVPSGTGAPPPAVPDLELLRRIGQSGFGQVWLAVNRATRRLRAVKLIPPDGRMDARADV